MESSSEHAQVESNIRRFVEESSTILVQTPRHQIHVRTWRLNTDTAGQPICVYMHGYRNNLHSFADLIPRLDLPAIAFDFQGYGQSSLADVPFVGLPDYLGDLQRVLDHFGVARPILIGHSMGARVGALWSALFPARTRALVMIDAYYHWSPPGAWIDRLKRYLEQLDAPLADPLEVSLNRLESFYLRQSPLIAPALAQHLARHSVRHTQDGRLIADWSPVHLRTTPVTLDDGDIESALSSLEIPALALQARTVEDTLTAFNLPHAPIQVRSLEGGHMLHWECPREVADAIHGWLAELSWYWDGTE